MIAPESKKVIEFIEYKPTYGGRTPSDRGHATVSTKYKLITFPGKVLDGFGWRGQFMKFYYEPTKKIIGWKVKKSVSLEELSDWIEVKTHSSSNQFRVSLTGMINDIPGLPKDHTFNKMEIERYEDKRLMSSNDVYYFVTLKLK